MGVRHVTLSMFVLAVLATTLDAGGVPPTTASPEAAWWSDGVTATLEQAGDRGPAWIAALQQSPIDHRPALAFLLEHMPTRDLLTLDPDFVLENVALACAARGAVPWGRAIPEEIFLNDVLPYANISERRDPWRSDFKERFLPMVRECVTPREAAHLLNQRIFAELGVKYSTARARADQSPAESIDSGLASCTGLSILLVNACRATGIPARVVGIPNWVNKSGNHTWVEIWDGGQWHFAGAAEPDERGLNHAWFTGRAARAQRDHPEHSIYAISYRRTGLRFPVTFDTDAEPAWAINVTDRYATPASPPDTDTRLLVTVVDDTGRRVAANVTVRAATDAATIHAGVSRDETHDQNDVLTFTIVRGERYEVVAGDTITPVTTDSEVHALTITVDTGGEG
ncbi:MAG: transglutaminase domain-containing protein [Phycisphaerales bacterium]|nr:transglutaminase domain-containing protein [Phycisphaerales bacterium]